MNIYSVVRRTKNFLITSITILGLLSGGCAAPRSGVKKILAPETNLGTTIGSLVEVLSVNAIPVEGYGLVGGLNGTGSSECPTQIREYLEKYILKQLPDQKADAGKLIDSLDTAVVYVQGMIPPAASKNQYFDVKITALPGTQTTSIENGWLYETELKIAGGFGITTKVLAKAEGPVFVDTIDAAQTNKQNGYILAGGTVLDEYKVSLALRQPDYKMANIIRNCINERFGSETAKAISESQIDLKIPEKYKNQKQRFVAIVRETYLVRTPDITKERIITFVRQLAVSKDKQTSEIALETIGNECLDKLSALLNSSDEEVRLRAARCMLNLGSDQGLKTLRQITMDKNSHRRIEALETITLSAGRNDATAILRSLLRDEDFNIRLAAYEQLRKLEDIAVTQKLIGHNFYLEQIAQADRKAIFVSRSGQPRIVLFAAPIRCNEGIFVESPDGSVTINAPAGQNYVSIMRKHPKRADVIIKLKSSFELGDIIRTLCEEPLKKSDQGHSGLNVSYSDMIALLQQMCDKGAIKAEFHAGPLSKIDLSIKK
jgi:flagellar basal body P-ring protein FlgI